MMAQLYVELGESYQTKFLPTIRKKAMLTLSTLGF